MLSVPVHAFPTVLSHTKYILPVKCNCPSHASLCSPVEENTEFLEDIRKASNGKGVILMCEAGGTTKPSPNFAAGKASRSLKVRLAQSACLASE